MERVTLSEFLYLYTQTFRQMGRLHLWIPMLLYGLLAYLLVLLHYHLFSPLFGPLLAFWIDLVKPSLTDAYFHYPAHFILLNAVYNMGRIVLNIITEAFLFGVLSDMLISLYNNEKPAFLKSFRKSLRRYFALTAIWAVMIAVQLIIGLYFHDFIENVVGISLQASPRRQIAADVAHHLLSVVVFTLFAFMLPSIILGKESWGRSIFRAVALVFRHPIVSFCLVFLPLFVIGFIPNWLAAQTETIVNNFFPELVFYVTVATIILDMLLYFIFMGTAVKFFMDRHEE